MVACIQNIDEIQLRLVRLVGTRLVVFGARIQEPVLNSFVIATLSFCVHRRRKKLCHLEHPLRIRP